MEYKIQSAVLPIAIVNAICFILQMTIATFTDSFILVGNDVFARPWILLTSMFLHGGVYHLLVNMYVLIMFGGLLEQKIGTRNFLILYFASGIIAAFISSFFYERALGASGAIMGLIGAMIILLPSLQLLFFFVIPMPLWVAGIFYVLIDTFGIIFPSGTGNIAHLSGMVIGLLYGLYLKDKAKKFHKKFARKKHLNEFDMDEYLRTGRI